MCVYRGFVGGFVRGFRKTVKHFFSGAPRKTREIAINENTCRGKLTSLVLRRGVYVCACARACVCVCLCALTRGCLNVH